MANDMTPNPNETEPTHIADILVDMTPTKSSVRDAQLTERAKRVAVRTLDVEITDLSDLRQEAFDDHAAGLLDTAEAVDAIYPLTRSLLDAQADRMELNSSDTDPPS